MAFFRSLEPNFLFFQNFKKKSIMKWLGSSSAKKSKSGGLIACGNDFCTQWALTRILNFIFFFGTFFKNWKKLHFFLFFSFLYKKYHLKKRAIKSKSPLKFRKSHIFFINVSKLFQKFAFFATLLEIALMKKSEILQKIKFFLKWKHKNHEKWPKNAIFGLFGQSRKQKDFYTC